jgi:hypothetical protein
MSKLTLSVDAVVVKRAKSYAVEHGTSISRMVERYLDLVVQPSTSSSNKKAPPALRMLRGAAKGLDHEDYNLYLVNKYCKK